MGVSVLCWEATLAWELFLSSPWLLLPEESRTVALVSSSNFHQPSKLALRVGLVWIALGVKLTVVDAQVSPTQFEARVRK